MINFPLSPSLNQEYSFSGKTWKWNGIAWEINTIVPSTGFTGSKGDPDGYTGSRGNDGFDGSRGVTGFVGSQGDQGVTGFTGADGFTGSQGVDGITGFDGSRGVTGFDGSLGFAGSIGFHGSTGFVGSKGDLGFTGSTGFAGSKGDVGFNGSLGFAGSAGFIGSKGDAGFSGSLGFVGSTGPSNIIFAVDDSDLTSLYPVMVTAAGSNQTARVASTALRVDASTGIVYVGGLDVLNSVQIDGNLTVSGTTTTLSAQNLALTDNMIYLNQAILTTIDSAGGNGSIVTYTTTENHNYLTGMSVFITGINPSAYNIPNGTITGVTTNTFTINSTSTGLYVSGGTARAKTNTNPDLGLAAGYNDGTYHHTGMFRDATDGVWKFFENYTPEPDSAVYIDTAHPSFKLAPLSVYKATTVSGYWANSTRVIDSSGNWVGSNSGLVGYVGSAGFAGSTGFAGSKGDVGFYGSVGFAGSKGDTGFVGSLGYAGSKGDVGFAGSKGDIGFTGSVGFVGSQGGTGFVGSVGNTGDTGFIGSRGDTGFTGSVGFNGSRGNTGFDGSKGDVGFTGSQGDQGDPGFTGPDGFTGSQGEAGITGFDGSIGSTGFDGSKGDVGFTGSLGFAGSTGIQGSTGYVGSKGDIGFYGSNGATGFAGSKGDTGFAGSKGDIGFYGSNGSTGFAGSKGDIGFYGSNGSTGFAGSQGFYGSTGFNGSVGFAGSIGFYGSTGFNGSVGFAGSKGDTGFNGSVGFAGSKGDIGFAGSIGFYGSAGFNGSVGFAGSKGDIGFVGSAGPSNVITSISDSASTVLYPVLVNGSGNQTPKISFPSLTVDAVTKTVKLDRATVNNFITLTGIATPTPAAGHLYFDTDPQRGLSFTPITTEASTAVTINVGQESLIYVHNLTSAAIEVGSVVYISGAAHGMHPSITKARANVAVDGTIALATMNIPDNSHGWVTRFGLVRDVNTKDLTPGTTLYLSADSAGKWTPVGVSVDSGFPIHIGKVIRADSATGTILVDPYTEHFEYLRIQDRLVVDSNISASTLDINRHADFTPILHAAAPAYEEGRLYYNQDAHTFEYYVDFDSQSGHLQIGEKEWVRCHNNSGGAIKRGQPVYVTGVDVPGDPIHGRHPTIALADATFTEKKDVIGLAMVDIANGQDGLIQVRGVMDDLNTSGLVAGDRFHLGTSPGTLVSTAPDYPFFPTDLGRVLVANAVYGTLYIEPIQHTMETLRITSNGRIDGNLTIGGDLNVVGVTTSSLTQQLEVNSNFLKLLGGNTLGTAYQNINPGGLNDATFIGSYRGDSNVFYFIDVVSTDSTGDIIRFGISDSDTIVEGDYGVPFDSAGSGKTTWNLLTDGLTAPMRNNISIRFVNATGHSDSDLWCGHPTELNLDLGFVGNYNPVGPGGIKYAGLYRDVNDARWRFFDGLTQNLDAGLVTISDSNGFTLSNVQANTFYGALSGNATTATSATQLATARTFDITGDVTATGVTFDGTGNVTLTTNIASGVIVNADINATAAIDDTKLGTISTALKVSNSATTATANNTPSAIIARDALGNFRADTVFLEAINITPYGKVIDSSGNWVGPNSGLVGFTGSIGFAGSNGSTGFAGSKGDIGFYGSNGSTGFAGSKGDTGFVGSKGDVGFAGSQGNVGFAGSKGDTGFTGSKGDIGFYGSNGGTGFTGSKGDIGFYGSVGFVGSKGDIGFYGSNGIGFDGSVGFTGSAGAGSVAGTNTQIIFNDSGVYGASSNLTFDKTTNIMVVGGAVVVNTNTNLNSEAITLATVTKTQIASFPVASFRSGKLIVQAYDSVTGEVQISELLVAHNGTIASGTEYGVVFTGASSIVTYDVDISAGNVRLMATRTSANSTQYKTSETLMVA